MPSVNVGETDFDVVATAANSAQERGAWKDAAELDKLARKINAGSRPRNASSRRWLKRWAKSTCSAATMRWHATCSAPANASQPTPDRALVSTASGSALTEWRHMRHIDRVAKTAKPSAKPSVPQPHGGALVPGAGGGPQPGSGRPKGTLKAFLTKLRKDPLAHDALEKAARDENSRNFRTAWKIAADYDDEKPAEKHTIVGPIVVKVSFSREGKRTTAS